MKRILLTAFAALAIISGAAAQPSQTLYTVMIEPDHADWTYKIGEEAEFKVYVINNKVPLNGIRVVCEYGPEMLPAVKTFELDIKKSSASFKVPGMKSAGFQTVRAAYTAENGIKYSSYTTIGYEPEKIEPTTTLPADFTQFWDDNLKAARSVPLEPLMTLMPERCTPEVDVYHVRYQNDRRGSYMYGILCIPKKPGKYPAILNVPGAGIRPYGGDVQTASRGVITFDVGIHGIPVDMAPEVYSSLGSAAISNYMFYNLDNKDTYYYKRVFTGCAKAVDVIYSLDKFNGTVGVNGGSQGGALSIITASLEPRIKYLTPTFPAMCDFTGYYYGRAGGWPHMFRDKNEVNIEAKIETSKYYDVVNFARFIGIPGYYTWGYNDTTCPPTSMYSAYNVITASKELKLFQETAHWVFPEENRISKEWMLDKLGVK